MDFRPLSGLLFSNATTLADCCYKEMCLRPLSGLLFSNNEDYGKDNKGTVGFVPSRGFCFLIIYSILIKKGQNKFSSPLGAFVF